MKPRVAAKRVTSKVAPCAQAARKRSAAPMIGKLVIFGVGLIGGSFALALKQKRAVRHVVGVGRSRANLCR